MIKATRNRSNDIVFQIEGKPEMLLAEYSILTMELAKHLTEKTTKTELIAQLLGDAFNIGIETLGETK